MPATTSLEEDGSTVLTSPLLETEGTSLLSTAPLVRRRTRPAAETTKTATTATTTTTSSGEGDNCQVKNRRNDGYHRQSTSRMLDRDGGYHQSRGRWNGVNVRHVSSTAVQRCWDNWFLNLTETPTAALFLKLFLVYTLTVILFAAVYLFTSLIGSKYAPSKVGGADHFLSSGSGEVETHPFCGMDITNHMEALYFSLSTMTTIGYGVSDYYFGDCWVPFVLVLCQVFFGIAFDAIALGLLFARLSRGQKRALTVIFSDRAVVQRVRGRDYLMFRVADLRTRPHIIEARIRAHVVRHDRHAPTRSSSSLCLEADAPDLSPQELETAHFVVRPLQLMGDTDLGSHVLLSVPHVVVHCIDDLSSPLRPTRPTWYDKNGVAHSSPNCSEAAGVDSEEATLAPSTISASSVAMSSFEAASSKARSLDASETTDENSHEPLQLSEDHEDIREFLADRRAEIVVFLEGIDEITGSAVQARHSYRWDDISFGCRLSPCVYDSEEGRQGAGRDDECQTDDEYCCIVGKCKRRLFSHGQGASQGADKSEGRGRWRWMTSDPSKIPACVVDFESFHDVVPASDACDWSPYVMDV